MADDDSSLPRLLDNTEVSIVIERDDVCTNIAVTGAREGIQWHYRFSTINEVMVALISSCIFGQLSMCFTGIQY